jgi:hypothetical protein
MNPEQYANGLFNSKSPDINPQKTYKGLFKKLRFFRIAPGRPAFRFWAEMPGICQSQWQGGWSAA